MNVNYVKGRRNEYKTMALLEAAGYECFRTAGSHGPFDVIAICKQGILLVQVKTNSNASLADMETMRDFPAPLNALKMVHRWNTRASLPIVREV